ncbi:MAG: hypothetical protein JWQ81_6168 [Amycolatopsis sp.]|uniref:recombinase family protein n=1 Tax=Amycolatopsis sp. TaxID=37632 RepID=UPI0026326321|nr:recombinase family protein [Amycolatopsis sp.]MCU1685429.1 hypothetical protein [Amycolatopsis sp.]
MKQTEPENRAVIYLRGNRAPLQRYQCQRIADKFGLTVVSEYNDYAVAARLHQQPALNQLLTDLERLRDVGHVVVWDYARLGRSMQQLAYIEYRLHACGAAITTITGVATVERFVHTYYGNDTPDQPPPQPCNPLNPPLLNN